MKIIQKLILITTCLMSTSPAHAGIDDPATKTSTKCTRFPKGTCTPHSPAEPETIPAWSLSGNKYKDASGETLIFVHLSYMKPGYQEQLYWSGSRNSMIYEAITKTNFDVFRSDTLEYSGKITRISKDCLQINISSYKGKVCKNSNNNHWELYLKVKIFPAVKTQCHIYFFC